MYGANIAYDLGLNKEALKLVAGFGGGMAIEDKCRTLRQDGTVSGEGVNFISTRYF